MKKSISILLVIVMVSGILSGCGIKKSDTENNKQKVTDLHSTENVKDKQSTDKSGDTG